MIESPAGIRDLQPDVLGFLFHHYAHILGAGMFGDVLQALLVNPKKAQSHFLAHGWNLRWNNNVDLNTSNLAELFTKRLERRTDARVAEQGRVKAMGQVAQSVGKVRDSLDHVAK